MRSALAVVLLWVGGTVAAGRRMASPPEVAGTITPLEVLGRTIYEREKCGSCHPDQLGPTDISAYENGEDIGLSDVGGKYPHAWHYLHFQDPRQVTPASKMPAYPHLLETRVSAWTAEAEPQAHRIVKQMKADLPLLDVATDREVIALIAYLQALQAPRPPAAEPAPTPEPAPPDPNDPATLAAGAQVYKVNCMPCHGKQLEGVIGSNLKDDVWANGGSLEDILRVTRDGLPAQGMPPYAQVLGAEACGQVAAFVYAASQEE